MVTTSGGNKLGAVLSSIAAKLSIATEVKVGFLEGATYPDGKSVAMVAAIQDYGSPSRGIPPRPFFRNMVAANKGHWPGDISKLLTANGYDAKKTLGQMGEEVKGELQQSIIDTSSPPLSPRTIARKGNAKPLVDTGHMLNSVNYEVG